MTSSHSVQSCQKCLKGGGQVLCGGCQQWFGLKHLNEHRQELSQQMEDLTFEHNELQQNLMLYEHDNDQEHSLIIRIDQWEIKSIDRIKQVADDIRQDLRKSFNRSKNKIQKLLRPMTHELEEGRHMETYTENDLAKWKKQLNELRKQLNDLLMMIELDHDEDEPSLTHLPLIQLRMIQKDKGKEQK